jgi:hypothetical protein
MIASASCVGSDERQTASSNPGGVSNLDARIPELADPRWSPRNPTLSFEVFLRGVFDRLVASLRKPAEDDQWNSAAVLLRAALRVRPETS